MTCAALCAFALPVCAQHFWSLDECIGYAETHSIEVQRRAVEVQQKDIQLSTSKYSRLPEVSAGIGEQLSFGNYNSTTGSMDGKKLEFNSDLSYTTGRLEVEVPIFEGLKVKNQIEADRFSLDAASADLDLARKNIGIGIASAYFECLYYKSVVEVASSQVELSHHLVSRAGILLEEGRKPQSELAEAEAQLWDDKYTLVEAQGNYKLARMSLCHKMNLPFTEDFEVAGITSGEGDLTAYAGIFDSVADTWPSIVAAKARIEQQKARRNIARSEYFPSLSFHGSLSSFYVGMFNHDLGWGGFSDQFFRNNHNEVLGLHLKIPIFNKMRVRNNVRIADLNIRNMELFLDEARMALQKEIQTAYTNAYVAYDKYISAEKVCSAAEISMNYAQNSYESGRTSFFEFQQSRQKYMTAQKNALQSKYDYFIRCRILRLYTEPSSE